MNGVSMYGLSAALCMVAVLTLSPLSRTLLDEHAPYQIAVIPLIFGLLFLLWMWYFIFRMAQAVKRR